ncbi:hypothetical protein [Frigoriglobus tundricola]|uniref:hypothetical protein n=1 Tax=Frigoriglobus tundricola TaxID=2774151 RepID=UPI00148EA608|nr:hypothetical protein [Frigoriglobus tundricola]
MSPIYFAALSVIGSLLSNWLLFPFSLVSVRISAVMAAGPRSTSWHLVQRSTGTYGPGYVAKYSTLPRV